MKNIVSSASKMVFILMALTSCIALLVGVLPVDQFMLLTTGAFAFYFSNKPTDVAGNITK